MFKRIDRALRRYIDGKEGTTLREEFYILEEKWNRRFKISLGFMVTSIFVISAFVYVFFLKETIAKVFYYLHGPLLRDGLLEPLFSALSVEARQNAMGITAFILMILIIFILVFTAVRYFNKLIRYINTRLG